MLSIGYGFHVCKCFGELIRLEIKPVDELMMVLVIESGREFVIVKMIVVIDEVVDVRRGEEEYLVELGMRVEVVYHFLVQLKVIELNQVRQHLLENYFYLFLRRTLNYPFPIILIQTNYCLINHHELTALTVQMSQLR